MEGAVWVEEQGDCGAFLAHLKAAAASGARALLVLACDGNGLTPAAVDGHLQALPLPVFGGIFPRLVHGGQTLSQGSIIVGLDAPVQVREVTGLSDPEIDFATHLETAAAELRGAASMLLVVDGLASRIATFLDGVYDCFGPDPIYFGGGAGSLDLVQRPCLFTRRGLRGDCAQLVALPWTAVVGVEHGWRPFAGPFLVTEARDNVIHALDFRPALEVYREVLEADSAAAVGADRFFDVAKAYPFGLVKPDGEIVVRDPIRCEGEALICVGEVPAHFMVHILRGTPDGLIAAADEVARQVGGALDGGRRRGPLLLLDCVSRLLLLEGRFDEEVSAVGKALPKGTPLVGALTLGEIADDRGGCLEFFNKTAVLTAWLER